MKETEVSVTNYVTTTVVKHSRSANDYYFLFCVKIILTHKNDMMNSKA